MSETVPSVMCPSLDEAALFDHGLDALDKHFLQIDRLLAPQTLRGKYVIVWLVIGCLLMPFELSCIPRECCALGAALARDDRKKRLRASVPLRTQIRKADGEFTEYIRDGGCPPVSRLVRDPQHALEPMPSTLHGLKPAAESWLFFC